MSNKALDQAGRAGAFHHLVRRKAAVTDTGLSTLKDIHSKVMYLHSKLKSRKEQKDQLNDLIPELFDKPKRKFVSNAYDTVRSAYKKPTRSQDFITMSQGDPDQTISCHTLQIKRICRSSLFQCLAVRDQREGSFCNSIHSDPQKAMTW
ncbi:hypothetical protein DPMN_069335 [Dreissena polymorpha]|uniref:Uncharacterized protein n=1 Tax=Dreissena polymorpha TaxID=45954 RepID=A0A9D3Z3B4_DREPO|nr:hypothetical protein DPMN_069335 [Dreissena polymorpha]